MKFVKKKLKRLLNLGKLPSKISYSSIIHFFDWRYRSASATFIIKFSTVTAFVLIAFLIRFFIKSTLERESPFIIFVLAVIVSAFYGGFRPGIYATLLSTILGMYFFQDEYGEVVLDTLRVVQAFIFFGIGLTVSLLVEFLNRSHRRTEHILESITDAFISLDNKWRFIYVNKQALPYFLRKDSGDLLGKKLLDVFPDLEGSEILNRYKEAIQLKRNLHFEAQAVYTKRWLDVHVYYSKDGISIYFTDITDRKEQDARKDDFISIASHELKTPVTSVRGYLQILKKRVKTVGLKSELGLINKTLEQIDRLNSLVEDLLDVSKIQSGKLDLKLSYFDFNKLVKETVELYQHTSKLHTIKSFGRIKDKVYADRDRLGQVLINLITNAIKYSPGGKRVIVRVEEINNQLRVGVEDFGIGISKKNQEKLFDKFFRVADSEETKPSGLGMGLHICSEIIKRHGGRIWVESEEGKGTIFYFELKIKKIRLKAVGKIK